jgi:hypothetical protein
MATSLNRRQVLQQLLAGLLQTGAALVLATGTVQAGDSKTTQDDQPLPEVDPNQPQPNLEQRAEEALANVGNGPIETGDEDAWINGGFRNFGGGGFGGFGGGGFRNSAFTNGGFGGFGGGFRNVGFGGGGFGGAFRNGGFANGGFGGGAFKNSAFRNW